MLSALTSTRAKVLAYTTENVKVAGAAAASVLDLLELIPEKKLDLPNHIFADNFFSSQELIEVLGGEEHPVHRNHQTGPCQRPSTAHPTVDKFKKKSRGYNETVVLSDQSQIVTWCNNNAPLRLISSSFGDKPMGTAARFPRVQKKYMDVPQPHVVRQYNKYMFHVYRFDQNNYYLRISVSGKKWFWPVVTWLVDTGMHNAWQLHKKSGGIMKLLAFKKELVLHHPQKGNSNPQQKQLWRIMDRSPRFKAQRWRHPLQHVSHFIKNRAKCRCFAMEGCTVKCVMYCGKCNCTVCINDFEQYHTRS
jgi:hypothetical protein